MTTGEKVRSILQISATTSLAIAIGYLGYSIRSFALVAPEIMDFLNKNDYQLTPAIEEVSKIRKMIPTVITEIQDIKKLVPAMTKEIAKISEQIPKALKTMDSSVDVISKATNEISTVRTKSLPLILEESKNIRTSIPVYINSTQKIIKDAHLVVKDASKISENTTSGVITGIVKAPFKLFSSLGSSISETIKNDGLSKKDVSILTKEGQIVINSNEPGFHKDWQNRETSRYGQIKLLSIDTIKKCKRLEIVIHTKNKKSIIHNYKFCKNIDENWSYVKED